MTTERDRLVELIRSAPLNVSARAEFSMASCTGIASESSAAHLADVLIANGWSRTVQRPEVDAEVEWGVRYGSDGSIESFGSDHEAARLWMLEGSALVSRAVGPWQEVQ